MRHFSYKLAYIFIFKWLCYFPYIYLSFCFSPTKTVYMEKNISPKWGLIYVEVRSHLGGMNQFSYKRFAFTKRDIPFCWDLSQVRRLTWVGWLFSNKQLLSQLLRQSNCTDAFCNQTVAFCKKSAEAFCKKLLPHFVINTNKQAFCIL